MSDLVLDGFPVGAIQGPWPGRNRGKRRTSGGSEIRAKGGIFKPPLRYNPRANSVSADISTHPKEETGAPRLRRILVALSIAAFANALIPAVFFSETRLFGQVDPRYRALVAAVVVAEYAAAFLLLYLHANVGFASGYAVATAVVVTLGSAALAFITLEPASWGWSAFVGNVLVLAAFAFAVVSNAVFLVASVRYARAIHPRLHLGGFFLGIAAFAALLFLYTRILP